MDTTIKRKVDQNVANDSLDEGPGVQRPADLLQDAVQAFLPSQITIQGRCELHCGSFQMFAGQVGAIPDLATSVSAKAAHVPTLERVLSLGSKSQSAVTSVSNFLETVKGPRIILYTVWEI